MKTDTTPPKWARKLLGWYCRPELLEDLEGDLNEFFVRNLKNVGPRKARMIYSVDVLKFFRPYTIRRPEQLNLFIQWIMISSYIKTSGRTMVRNKLFSTINIVGLAISMSVGLIMIGVLDDILSYDKFHLRHADIYRVISRYQYLENKDEDFMATTSLKAGMVIRESFSVPEEVVILRRDFGGDLKAGEKIIPLSGLWANESLFKVFDFKLQKGNPETALRNPFSVVLTERSARKLFGDEDAIGKIVSLKERDYTVTGILENVPTFSHIRFEMLGSLSTREIIVKENQDELKWDNIWNTWVYLLLPHQVDLKNLQSDLDKLSVREDPSVKNTHIELALQPVDNIMLGPDLGNQIGPVLGNSAIWIFGGLAFVVILSACFNYTNLSIARSLRRSREVGIRKVIGALRSHVMGQFVVEAILISLCALVLACAIFVFLRPFFLGMERQMSEIFVLNLSPSVILYFVLLAIVVGLVAGFLPALFFSGINAMHVLKYSSSPQGFKKLSLRKALIVFQYCISIIFITSTVIVYKQYRHFVAFDLGFKTDNVLNISLQGNKADAIRNELSSLNEVKGISQSTIVTSVGNYWGTQMKYAAHPDDSAGVYYNTIDENYLPLHGHILLAGRNFTAKTDSSAESEVIVNQEVLKRFDIADQNPAKALDEVVKVDGKNLRIIGVMKDFQYGQANSQNTRKEVVFRYSARNANVLNVKIQSSDLLSAYEKIEAIWKKIDPIHPFEAKFYNDQLEEAFSGLKASVRIAGFLAFLAICIASMGLLGMVVFTTETRLKEISIRKVLGANERGLLFLLGKGFFVLLGIAAIIAIPITYLFFERFAFREFANPAPISGGDLSFGALAIMIIAFLMIGWQTLKAARCNPAEVLKNE